MLRIVHESPAEARQWFEKRDAGETRPRLDIPRARTNSPALGTVKSPREPMPHRGDRRAAFGEAHGFIGCTLETFVTAPAPAKSSPPSSHRYPGLGGYARPPVPRVLGAGAGPRPHRLWRRGPVLACLIAV
jgi:hypothetical protein